MSDDILKIIPIDPQFVPDAGTHQRAVKFLEDRFPDGEMCEAKLFDEVQFIDCGENLEAVVCPNCRKRSELHPFADGDAVTSWWIETQDLLERSDTEELQTSMFCCNATVPFTSLEFDLPAGFARFELSIWNPNESKNLNEEELRLLARLLGCELAQVRAHY